MAGQTKCRAGSKRGRNRKGNVSARNLAANKPTAAANIVQSRCSRVRCTVAESVCRNQYHQKIDMTNALLVCSPRGRYVMTLSNVVERPANEVSQGRMISSRRVKEFDHMARSLIEMLQMVDDLRSLAPPPAPRRRSLLIESKLVIGRAHTSTGGASYRTNIRPESHP